jgi:hypothetical protein
MIACTTKIVKTLEMKNKKLVKTVGSKSKGMTDSTCKMINKEERE